MSQPTVMAAAQDGFGPLLSDWRRRRRLSQLALSLEAEVSQRHLAFLERGRARPSRSMVLTLARALELPLSAQNDLLIAAGFAPLFPRRSLDDAALAPIRRAMLRMIERHEPYPALVIDADWRVVAANRPAEAMFGPLLAPYEGDMLAMFQGSETLRAAIENWDEVGPELLERLQREARADGRPDDPRIAAFAEMVEQTCGAREPPVPTGSQSPLLATRLRLGDQRLAFHSTLAGFGGPQDIALAELRVELFFPADDATETALEAMAAMAAAAG